MLTLVLTVSLILHLRELVRIAKIVCLTSIAFRKNNISMCASLANLTKSKI